MTPDPLLAAGHVTCSHCQWDSWPITAQWLTRTLLAVEYHWDHRYTCPYRNQSGVVLLDTTAADQSIRPVHRPRICRGTTRRGAPCKAYAQPESAFCHSHNPVRQAAA
jgi:hypothetical protein